ncbi:MAG TPA: J domain-containing protein [Xanthobacteraceae bacterium]|nr:J domain-containing protein [Xanthobacteraceae bacterium]
MNFDSPLFDRIRVKPNSKLHTGDSHRCEWKGCDQKATHRAPKGRLREREYWRFCLEHVRQYNNSYNYFAGMSDEAIMRYQKEAVTGHRPTWRMGVGRFRLASGLHGYDNAQDAFGIFREYGTWRPKFERTDTPQRPVRNAERKALGVLGLEVNVTAADIKARFKELVKRHHPDVNGGDRAGEDRLREIIQAYNYLKSVKFR